MQGIIIGNISNMYQIKTEKTVYKSYARGRFKKEEVKPMVGDVVDIEIIDAEKSEAIIENIKPRKNEIKRPKIANIDQIVFIISTKNPKPDLLMLDKQLVYVESLNIEPIIVINKIDLENKLDKSILDNYIEISAKENIGIEKIKDEIKRLFNLGELEASDLTYMSNARSISLLGKSLNNINDAISEINNNSPIDIVEFHLKDAWNNLGEIIGETYTDELLDELFSRFCLGK